MKIGDYVAKITNEWQKHNRWMEFPDEKPEPLGIIISRGRMYDHWGVLKSDGEIIDISENQIEVLDEAK
jgi:hypothetical protein